MAYETEASSFVISFLKEFGFPVFVATWALLRTDKVIKANTEALQGVKDVVSKCQNQK